MISSHYLRNRVQNFTLVYNATSYIPHISVFIEEALKIACALKRLKKLDIQVSPTQILSQKAQPAHAEVF